MGKKQGHTGFKNVTRRKGDLDIKKTCESLVIIVAYNCIKY